MKNTQCRNLGFLKENRIKQATEMCSNQLITHYLLVIQKTVYDIFQRGKRKKNSLSSLLQLNPISALGKKRKSKTNTPQY